MPPSHPARRTRHQPPAHGGRLRRSHNCPETDVNLSIEKWDTNASAPFAFQASAKGLLEPDDGQLAQVFELIIKDRVKGRMDSLKQVSPFALINLLMIPRGCMIKVRCRFHRQPTPQKRHKGVLLMAPSLHPVMTAPNPSTTSPRSTTFLTSLTPERNVDIATAAISSHRN